MSSEGSVAEPSADPFDQLSTIAFFVSVLLLAWQIGSKVGEFFAHRHHAAQQDDAAKQD